MIDSNTLSLFRERYKALTADGRGDTSDSTKMLTLGLVVNTDDPLEQGRLQIFCPALNDNPKKIQHLPWAAYITPFGGSINNKNFTRGTGDGTATSEGAIHYGFWGVPELGAHVLVGCIDGDPRRRFWVGCLPEHQETHTMFNGRFDWNSKEGTPDGPLTSSKEPIQPLYDNWTKAFADRTSREWKTRGADYEPMAVAKSGNGSPSRVRGEDYLDETYEGLSKAEKDEWVRDALGAPGYDWSGFKNAGAMKASRVYGMSTPGFHSFSMDDRPFNSRMKLRTATGHMILMDDTNERIYIMTNKGNNWIELDSNGNIDMFSENRVSIHSVKDMNLTAGETIRMHASKGIHMYAGFVPSDQNDAPLLTDEPAHGEIRIQSESDISMRADNIRQRSDSNMYREVGINLYENIVGSSFTDVLKGDISIRTIAGDYIQSVAKDLHETIIGNSKRLSYGTSAISSNGNNEVFSFAGSLAIGSQTDVTMKAASGNVNVEAVGKDGQGGNINHNTPKSQTSIGENGVQTLTAGSVSTTAGQTISHEVNPGTAAGKTGPLEAANPLLMGATGAAGLAAFVMSATGVSIKSAADFNIKTSAVYNSFNDMSAKLNSVITQANTTGIYVVALVAATQALAAAAGESFTPPTCSLNVGAMKAALFNAVIPPSMLAMYSDLNAINTRINELGLEGITAEMLGLDPPLTTENMVAQLKNNAAALIALGLPADVMSMVQDPCGGIATMILNQLNLPILVEQLAPLEIPNFRQLVHQIFDSVAPGSTVADPPAPVAAQPLSERLGPMY